MRPKRLDKARRVVTTVLLAALVAMVSYVVSSEVVRHGASSEFQLTSGTGFSITGTVDATYTAPNEMCSGTPALLYPGAAQCLDVDVTNPLTVPLTVTNLTVTGVARSPSTTTHTSCTPTSATFTFTATDFSGALPVGPRTTASVGRPLTWKSNGTQNPCEGATFTFTYTGTATYTDGTTTAITATPRTQTPGEPVTLVVTVTGMNPSVDTHTPTGTVKFYLLTSACSSRSVATFASAPVSGGTAHLVTSTLPSGTDCIQAVYEDAGADFTSSTSNMVHVRIGSASTRVTTTTTLTSPAGPATAGQPVVFTATVTGASGTPTGTVSFYLCSSETNPTTCTTELGTATIVAPTQEASLDHAFTAAGTYYIVARYAGTPSFTASASSIYTQTVATAGTTTTLTSSLDPSLLGQSVALTARLRTTTGVGVPTGTVTFALCKTASCQAATALDTKALSGGKATISVSTLPAGHDYLYAAYMGTSTFMASQSSVLTEKVVGPPPVCAPGGYTNYMVGYAGNLGVAYVFYSGLFGSSPVVVGTNGNDFFYLPGGSFVANGLNGDDCIFAGTGDDWLFEGTGNDGVQAGNGTDLVVAGNGSDKVLLGTGPADRVTLGNGSDTVTVGNGAGDVVTAGSGGGDSITVGKGNDTVRVGNGNFDQVIVGSGNDTVVVGNGSKNRLSIRGGNDAVTLGNGSTNTLSLGNGRDTVSLGDGSKNTVTLGSGIDTIMLRSPASSDTVTAGAGIETVFLGAGTHNTFTGTSKSKDVCHLPKPRTSHRGSTPVRYYDDTVTNCRVVETR